ncbi:MAG: ABC transporter ATP-binding protein [Lachnospiraceae bacterium]|nr:ABC transporter ATP-binding protein [Lachnospiraceae bacterium]
MNVLRIEDCSISYGTQALAVERVSMEANQGEIVSIVGESGSGKSTLLRAIMGLLPSGGTVVHGKICFQGRELTAMSEAELQVIRGKHIAMVFQNPGETLDPVKRVESQYRESIRAHERQTSKSRCHELAEKMLQAMHLADAKRVLRSYPVQLSGGMKQRVGIAMSMTARPALLLADEPTSALDVTIQAQVAREMRELRDQYGTAIVLVTHNMGVASYLSDKIGVMNHGRLVEFGTRDQIIFHPEEAYTKKLLEAVPKLGGERYAR